MPKVIPGQRKRWPRKDKVIECRLAHPTWSTYQIGRHIGCDHATVWRALKNAGLRLAWNKFSRKLQPHELQSVADLYGEGVKSEAIAAEFGIDCSTVAQIARRRGHPPRLGYPRGRLGKLNADERQAVADLYAAGEKLKVIAAKYGITNSSVRGIARRYGLPGRTSPNGAPYTNRTAETS